MDQSFDDFREMQGFDDCSYNGVFDVPLSNEFLNGFNMEDCQAQTSGAVPFPDYSNLDVPGNCRQSPLLPFLSEFSAKNVSSPSDKPLGANNDPLISHHRQQRSQELCTNTGSNPSGSHFNTSQSLSNGSNNCSMQHLDPSMTGLSSTNAGSTNAGQNLKLAAPSKGSLCVSENLFQNSPATAPLSASYEQTATMERPMSTHMSNAQKVNNTFCASVPADLQHSPTLKSMPHPSHSHHQTQPQSQQYSPPTLRAASHHNTNPQIMSSTHDFTQRQESNALPVHSDLQNAQRLINRPPFRRIASAHNQIKRSPVLHNHQPFQESSLRTSVTPNWGINAWEAGQYQNQRYPDPQTVFQQQSHGSPYMGHHHISGHQAKSMINHSPEQYWSNPMSVKREMSSPDSEHNISTPILKSQINSPKPERKRRVKQEPKNNDDNEVAIDAIALQTADLTTLDGPMDHINVKELIDAMHNIDEVEDNLGMQKTWKKVGKAKAMRIREVCVELLKLTKQAQQQSGVPLGDKKVIKQYATFQERFNALRATLRFQKTVCKHLIEPPYSFHVVDDPEYAANRVKNNRKVNLQKAEAIRLGREHLGEKGQGKGKPMLKTKKRGRAQMEDDHNDEVDSADESPSDDETDASSYAIAPKSARRNVRPSKRTRSSSNSNQRQEQESSAEASYLPQAHDVDDPFSQSPHQNAYACTPQAQMLPEHDRMHHGLANGHHSSTLNQQYPFPSGSESGTGFYGDNSTGGSDSEGLGSTSHGCN